MSMPVLEESDVTERPEIGPAQDPRLANALPTVNPWEPVVRLSAAMLGGGVVGEAVGGPVGAIVGGVLGAALAGSVGVRHRRAGGTRLGRS